ncbi:MAG: GAF domain-containing SpoIIE family protein phosphatase, partial [Planctomycetota bacterium]
SLLATRGTTVEQTLEEVLSSSLDVFDLDAGSIVLFPEDQDGVAAMDDERELIVKASSGLSRQWLDSPVPLSEGRVFDRLALDGEVITAADLQKDPRVIEPERCAMERLRSFMTAAMTFRGRPIGVIRLYGREPRQFGASESRLLRSVAEQSAAAVQQARFIVIQRRERRLEHQLRLAGNVQGRMLPERLPRLDGLALAARSVPTRLLGGDFFDMFELDGRVALVIGDVVGKGVPAALLMSAVLATLRAHAEHTGDVSELVGRVNDALVRDSQPNEFTTLWVGLIDPSTGVLTYTGAGHEPPFVVRARGGIVPRMEDVMPLGLGGLAAGVLAGESYPTLEHRLEPGDVLVAHTDGVTDAMSYDGARFGWDRLVGAALE